MSIFPMQPMLYGSTPIHCLFDVASIRRALIVDGAPGNLDKSSEKLI